jgi:hypothetical protein
MEGSLVAYKVFTNGSVLNASEINENLMNQSVMVFSNATARSAALTSPTEGMLTWLEDSNRYESYSGTVWQQVITPGAWIAYTPTFTNFTLGNGTIAFRYTQIGKTVHLHGSITLGTTSIMGSILGVSFPVNSSSNTLNRTLLGSAYIEDAEISAHTAMVRKNTDTEFQLFVLRSDALYVTGVPLSTTVPFIWGTGDFVRFTITYEAA